AGSSAFIVTSWGGKYTLRKPYNFLPFLNLARSPIPLFSALSLYFVFIVIYACSSTTDALVRMDRGQLQKFAQYLIASHPNKVLPSAQLLADQLLQPESNINKTSGAPDPTAGASLEDVAAWYLDEMGVRDQLRTELANLASAGSVSGIAGYVNSGANNTNNSVRANSGLSAAALTVISGLGHSGTSVTHVRGSSNLVDVNRITEAGSAQLSNAEDANHEATSHMSDSGCQYPSTEVGLNWLLRYRRLMLHQNLFSSTASGPDSCPLRRPEPGSMGPTNFTVSPESCTTNWLAGQRDSFVLGLESGQFTCGPSSHGAGSQIAAMFAKVRELLTKRDSNGPRLLSLITEELLRYPKIPTLKSRRTHRGIEMPARVHSLSRSASVQQMPTFQLPTEQSSSATNPASIGSGPNYNQLPGWTARLWEEVCMLWTCVVLNPDCSADTRRNWRHRFIHWTRAHRCPRDEAYAVPAHYFASLRDPNELEDEGAVQASTGHNHQSQQQQSQSRSVRRSAVFQLPLEVSFMSWDDDCLRQLIGLDNHKRIKSDLVELYDDQNDLTPVPTMHMVDVDDNSTDLFRRPTFGTPRRPLAANRPQSASSIHSSSSSLSSSPARDCHCPYCDLTSPLNEPFPLLCLRVAALRANGYFTQALRLAVFVSQRLLRAFKTKVSHVNSMAHHNGVRNVTQPQPPQNVNFGYSPYPPAYYPQPYAPVSGSQLNDTPVRRTLFTPNGSGVRLGGPILHGGATYGPSRYTNLANMLSPSSPMPTHGKYMSASSCLPHRPSSVSPPVSVTLSSRPGSRRHVISPGTSHSPGPTMCSLTSNWISHNQCPGVQAHVYKTHPPPFGGHASQTFAHQLHGSYPGLSSSASMSPFHSHFQSKYPGLSSSFRSPPMNTVSPYLNNQPAYGSGSLFPPSRPLGSPKVLGRPPISYHPPSLPPPPPHYPHSHAARTSASSPCNNDTPPEHIAPLSGTSSTACPSHMESGWVSLFAVFQQRRLSGSVNRLLACQTQEARLLALLNTMPRDPTIVLAICETLSQLLGPPTSLLTRHAVRSDQGSPGCAAAPTCPPHSPWFSPASWCWSALGPVIHPDSYPVHTVAQFVLDYVLEAQKHNPLSLVTNCWAGIGPHGSVPSIRVDDLLFAVVNRAMRFSVLEAVSDTLTFPTLSMSRPSTGHAENHLYHFRDRTPYSHRSEFDRALAVHTEVADLHPTESYIHPNFNAGCAEPTPQTSYLLSGSYYHPIPPRSSGSAPSETDRWFVSLSHHPPMPSTLVNAVNSCFKLLDTSGGNGSYPSVTPITPPLSTSAQRHSAGEFALINSAAPSNNASLRRCLEAFELQQTQLAISMIRISRSHLHRLDQTVQVCDRHIHSATSLLTISQQVFAEAVALEPTLSGMQGYDPVNLFKSTLLSGFANSLCHQLSSSTSGPTGLLAASPNPLHDSTNCPGTVLGALARDRVNLLCTTFHLALLVVLRTLTRTVHWRRREMLAWAVSTALHVGPSACLYLVTYWATFVTPREAVNWLAPALLSVIGKSEVGTSQATSTVNESKHGVGGKTDEPGSMVPCTAHSASGPEPSVCSEHALLFGLVNPEGSFDPADFTSPDSEHTAWAPWHGFLRHTSPFAARNHTNSVAMAAQLFRSAAPYSVNAREHICSAVRTMAMQAAAKDPINCALPALTLAERNAAAFDAVYRLVLNSAETGALGPAQLFSLARYMDGRGWAWRAFPFALHATRLFVLSTMQDSHPVAGHVLWACSLAHRLGPGALQELLGHVIRNIHCPTLLTEILHRCRMSPSGVLTNHSNPTLLSSNAPPIMDLVDPSTGTRNPCPPNFGSSSSIYYGNCVSASVGGKLLSLDRPPLKGLLDAAVNAFVTATHTRLSNISPRQYAEFVDFLARARDTFHLLRPDGPAQFRSLVECLRQTYRGKRKLVALLAERFG
ncbi:uncharacterized protein DEA37_0000511, partial [Paragonimus westermani]